MLPLTQGAIESALTCTVVPILHALLLQPQLSTSARLCRSQQGTCLVLECIPPCQIPRLYPPRSLIPSMTPSQRFIRHQTQRGHQGPCTVRNPAARLRLHTAAATASQPLHGRHLSQKQCLPPCSILRWDRCTSISPRTCPSRGHPWWCSTKGSRPGRHLLEAPRKTLCSSNRTFRQAVAASAVASRGY